MSSEVSEALWQELRESAIAAMGRAYCPYSNYPVGAAALVDDGRIVSGSNIENSAYGVTLCAECSLVSDLIKTGGGKLVAFYCVNALKEPTAPCGRCRQVLSEHAAPNLVLEMPAGRMTMAQVLPGAFGIADLEDVEKKTSRKDDHS